MQGFKFSFHSLKTLTFSFSLGMLLFMAGCKKETLVTEIVTYDNIIYQLDSINLYQSASEKNRVKNSTQFYSILYAHLFNKTISPGLLNNLSVVTLAMGDKTMARELIVMSFLEKPDAVLPTEQQMKDNIGAFVTETFIRFYLRMPTEYELFYLTEMITNDQKFMPVHLYEAVLLSDEYLFY